MLKRRLSILAIPVAVLVLALGTVSAPPTWAEECGGPYIRWWEAPKRQRAAPAPAAPAASTITGRFEARAGQRILTLWGTPKQRGYAQGYLLAESILAGVEHDFDSVLKPYLQRYETIVRKMVVPQFRFSPRENAELEGLYEGCKAKLGAKRLHVKALGRAFDLIDIKALNTFGDWYGLGCSSLAVWGDRTVDGSMLVGRNFDFPGFELLLAHQFVVVRARDGDRSGFVGVSYPGSIGTMTGMSAAGVFVAVHDVRIKPTLDKALRPNVPRLVAVRRLLERTRGPEACLQARDFARSWPTLYGNNLMVVAPGRQYGVPRAAVLEYDSRSDVDGGATMRVADRATTLSKDEPSALCLACTNHHRCRTEPEGYADLYKRWRYGVLSAAVPAGDGPRPFDVAGLFEHMEQAAFPRAGKPQRRAEAAQGEARAHGTLHQVVGEPGPRRLHIRIGAIGRHISQQPARRYDVLSLVWAATNAK